MRPRELESHPLVRAMLTVCYSQFSPIPKHVMDGGEPGDLVPAAILSGAPVDLQARTVRYATSYNGRKRTKLTSIAIEFTDPQKRLRNQAIGMDTIGVWTGTYSRRVTGGKIL